MTNFVITLKWVLLVITVLQVDAEDTHGIEKRDTNSKKIVCYYTNWSVYRPGTAKFSPQNINPYLCTHLIYAFGGLNKENGLRPYDKYQDIEQGGYAKFTGLKTYNKNLKTMLAIGGWNEGSSRFSALVADVERRSAFVKNALKFLRQNNFDGLDLDWEYPAFRDGSKAADKENYASLVRELREEFDKESSKTGRQRLLLTMAVPAGIEYINKGYDIPKLNRYLDFMNILNYDYHSAYESTVNHHSPLYSLQDESEYNFDSQLTIEHTINHYLKKGADPEKLVLGIPTYGRSYTLFNPDSTDLNSPADGPGEQGEATREKGYLSYFEICANIASDEWTVVQPKKSAMGPYAYRGNQWVGYDDTEIVKLKAQYINDKGLGGIMYWSIDNDDFRGKCHGKPYPLIEAGKQALLANSGVSDNTILASTDEKRKKSGRKPNLKLHQSTTAKPRPSKMANVTTSTTTINALSTPEPPTTPDPGTDFVCKEDGFFPHPRDCKKYFWCLDSGPSNLGIVAHQFTCPSGLVFNKASDSCDYSRNVICNKKSEATTITTTTTTTAKTAASAKSSTSTTTTTTEAPVEEEYEDEDTESEEDPKAIKQLITLIKKLGGIAELEKQLKIEDGSAEVTTPAISKNLYQKVFNGPTTLNRFKNQPKNGPSGPQNEGLSSDDDDDDDDDVPYHKKDKPQYVTIQRNKSKIIPQDTEDSGTTNNKAVQPQQEIADDEESDINDEEVTSLKYSSSPRSRSTAKSNSLKYVVLERNRTEKTTTTEDELETEPSSTTHRYITLVRPKPNITNNELETTSTESSKQQSSSPKTTKSDNTERDLNKSREKVSSSESTTSARNMSTTVTSARNFTVIAHNLTTTENPLNSTSHSNTFLVFAQKPTIEAITRGVDHDTAEPKSSDPETSLAEIMTTSTMTTIITTIRESATEKTRIPLRRLKDYFKKNRTDSSQNDLRSNDVLSKKSKFTPSTTESTDHATGDKNYVTPITRKNFFNRKRLPATQPDASSKISNGTSETSSETTTTFYSRLYAKRNRTSVSATSEPNAFESTPRYSRKTTAPESSEEGGLRSRYSNRFRPRTDSSTESDADSSFRKRRLSTTERTLSSTLSVNSFSKTSSRFFLKSRKTATSPAADTTIATTTETSPTTRRRFTKSKFSRKTTRAEILDSEENRYRELDDVPTAAAATDNLNVTETTIALDERGNTSPSSIGNSRQSTADDAQPENSNKNTVAVDENAFTSKTTVVNLETSSQQPTYARIAPRNNSRFLKNPEREHNAATAVTSASASNRNATQQAAYGPTRKSANRTQIEYPDMKVRPREKARQTKASTTTTSKIETETRARGRKKFVGISDPVVASNAFIVEHNVGDADSVPMTTTTNYDDSRRRSRARVGFSTTIAESPVETTSINPRIKNRGKIKAYNSLSRAEIKELASSQQPQPNTKTFQPKSIIEETFAVNNYSPKGGNSAIQLRPKSDLHVTNADNFDYNRIYTIPEYFDERLFDDATDAAASPNENAISTQLPDNLDFSSDDFRVSETKYIANDNRNVNARKPQTMSWMEETTIADQTEPASRLRGNVRRTGSMYSRSRSSTTTTTTTTTTTEYTPSESNKLTDRFRRRKTRPDNTARSQNYVPSESQAETSRVTRPRNFDIFQRVTTPISDYLPVPAPLYRFNQSSNKVENTNSENLNDLDTQSIDHPTTIDTTEDIADLANSAVAALSSLRTMPPASSQVTFTKTAVPLSSQITYAKAIEFPDKPPHRMKSAPRTTASVPLSGPNAVSSHRRGTAAKLLRRTTTQVPSSLRDIYNDYSEIEYHAEPVEIPVTGKVRIHSDGYIECLDMGNFPHPFSCKKFISCAKMEYDSLLGWEYTCPKGLSFDPIGGICNWAAGLGCKE